MGAWLACAGVVAAGLALWLALARDRAVIRRSRVLHVPRVPDDATTRAIAELSADCDPLDSDELWLENFCRAPTIAQPSDGIPVAFADFATSRALSEPTTVDASAYESAPVWLHRRATTPSAPLRRARTRGKSENTTATGARPLRAATPSW